MMDEKETALYFYRKMVYVVYLEVGAFQASFHPELAQKAKIKTAFFERERERQAAALYDLSVDETDPEKILAPYVERTGLTLEDVERLFREGNWRNKFGGYSSGGPRWARIAQVTLELKDFITKADWAGASELVYDIKKLKTNQVLLIQLFERGDRRR